MICVLMAASGAAWESSALGLLRARSDVVVLKRCVDVDDLLATAVAGQADVAVLSLDAPGLDAASIEVLRRHRVRPVAVLARDGDGSAFETAGRRALHLGITAVVGADDLAGLGTAVTVGTEEPSHEGASSAGLSEEDGDHPGAGGHVLAVWGPRGAPGRTTVAVSCAAELAARGQRTLLVDADPYGGAIAAQLGVLDEVSGLLAAARLATTGGLQDRLATVARSLAGQLSVVTGLPRPDRWVEVRQGAIEIILHAGRSRGQVIVDTGFSLEQDPGSEFGSRPGRNTLTLGALAEADAILVVGNADPVGLAHLARGLVELREVVGARPVWVAVNRQRSTLGWSERDIVGMVEGFARVQGVHFLPEDRAAVDRALIAGKTLVEGGDSPLRRAVSALVDSMFPESLEAAGPGRLRRRTAGRARRR